MSYWLEDTDGGYLGDLATNVGIIQLRDAGSPSLVEFLDAGEADEDLLKDVIQEAHDNPRLAYLADLLEGVKAPVCVTDGCGQVQENKQ